MSPYRSPVRLVLHAAEATSPYSVQAINRARKKMMAEIALGGDEVVIDEISYSRNDAATLLDAILEDAWWVHCIVYTYPGLLNFLEKQTFDNGELKKADAYLYDQRFVSVVSPYFSYSFNAVSGLLIKTEEFSQLLQLLSYRSYMLPEHQHEAFQKIRIYLEELSYTLRNLSWEKFMADEAILHFVFSEEWQKSMNALPPSFNTQRDEIVTHLIEIVLRFQQKATWYYLHQVLVHLQVLETNDFNRHEIARIDEVIFANTKIESGSSKKDNEFSSGRVIWWGLWFVLMIIRAATCNDRSGSSYRYNDYAFQADSPQEKLDNITEKQNEKILLQQLDSLLGKIAVVTPAAELKSGGAAFDFSDDPKMARNDSLLVTNNTNYDAVFLYFKDIPEHSLSGRLPKFYSTYIKKGESEKVYVLAGNGRVYFAFGEQWGKLAKPINLAFPDFASRKGIVQPTGDTLTLAYFFRNGKKQRQKYLQHPLYIEPATVSKDAANYHYLNTGLRIAGTGETKLVLSSSASGITIKVEGPLTVKEELFQSKAAVVK